MCWERSGFHSGSEHTKKDAISWILEGEVTSWSAGGRKSKFFLRPPGTWEQRDFVTPRVLEKAYSSHIKSRCDVFLVAREKKEKIGKATESPWKTYFIF